MPLPASSSRAGGAAPSRGHVNLHLTPPGTSWLAQGTLAKQVPALPWASPLLCFPPPVPKAKPPASSPTAWPFLSGKPGKIHALGQQTLLPLRLGLLPWPAGVAKGESRQQVPREVDVPPLRKAVCGGRWPSSQAECAICFPVLDLAYDFLLKQLVAKVINASACTQPVRLPRAKSCSHRILPRGRERLPLNLQHSWVSEIPYLDTGEAHPTFLLYRHRASSAPWSVWEQLLMQDISSVQIGVTEN